MPSHRLPPGEDDLAAILRHAREIGTDRRLSIRRTGTEKAVEPPARRRSYVTLAEIAARLPMLTSVTFAP